MRREMKEVASEKWQERKVRKVRSERRAMRKGSEFRVFGSELIRQECSLLLNIEL